MNRPEYSAYKHKLIAKISKTFTAIRTRRLLMTSARWPE